MVDHFTFEDLKTTAHTFNVIITFVTIEFTTMLSYHLANELLFLY